MKTYKKLFFLAIAVLLIQSCSDSVLDQSPITEKEATNFYSNEKEIESAVSATYAILQSNGLYGLYLPAFGEVISDNAWEEVANNDEGIYGQLDFFTTTPTNGLIAAIWKDSYIGIQRANIVLNRIDDINFKDASKKSARIGEMKFIRSLLYFNLVRIFGDVPLVTEETTDPADFFGKGRTASTLVYDQIVDDLIGAINDLSSVLFSQEGRATKVSAQALLGQVYATLGKLDLAKVQLDEVLNSQNYGLLPTVNEVFDLNNEGNSEIIFAVKFTSGLGEGSSAFVQYSPAGRADVSGGKGHNLMEKTLYDKYSLNDQRLGVYVDITSANIPYSLKLKKNTGGDVNDGGSDMVVIRYADIVLLQAEIEANLNNLNVAESLLNTVRNRAGLLDTNAITKEELLADIYLERRLELANEGQRWFDLKRRGSAVQVMNDFFQSLARNISMDQNDLFMPIPQSQIDTDSAIVQNPGY